MLNLSERIALMVKLGDYIKSDSEWTIVKNQASTANAWFITEFVENSIQSIADGYLTESRLNEWAGTYITNDNHDRKNVGVVMAGNIPLVGFHDFLSVFIAGHRQTIKLSSKDNILLPHLIGKLKEWQPEIVDYIQVAEILKGCDAFIATGSNNSGRYFDHYFGKFPNIIRKNRTSVAILEGNETAAELDKLADDISLYFGMGCRNVTQLIVPENYDFIPLLNALRKYDYLIENHKYKHNYDYALALLIINQKYYMTNDTIVLSENESVFSPVSQLHYRFYNDVNTIESFLEPGDIQCIVGKGHFPFGAAQCPALDDYADGVDTMAFLTSL